MFFDEKNPVPRKYLGGGLLKNFRLVENTQVVGWPDHVDVSSMFFLKFGQIFLKVGGEAS